MLYERIFPPVSTGSSLPALTQRMRTLLPANPFILGACWPPGGFQIHQIQNDLARTQVLLQLVSRDTPGRNNDDLGILQNLAEIVLEQQTDVRNRLFNVFAIGADKPPQGYVVIPDFDVASFAQQVLDELHLRAFPKVVGRSLETQSQNRDLFLALLEHHVHGSLQVL